MAKEKILESGFMLKIIVSSFKSLFKGKIGEFYNIGSNKNLNNLQVSNELLNISRKIIKLDKK